MQAVPVATAAFGPTLPQELLQVVEQVLERVLVAGVDRHPWTIDPIGRSM